MAGMGIALSHLQISPSWYPPLLCSQAPQRRWRKGTEEQSLEMWWLSPWVEVCFRVEVCWHSTGAGKEGAGLGFGVEMRLLGTKPKSPGEVARGRSLCCVISGSRPFPSSTFHCFIRHQLRSTHRHSYEELQVGDYRALSSKCRGLSERGTLQKCAG